MRRIFISLARSKGVLGKLIRWFTESEVNHSYIVFYSNEWQDWMAIEINEHGVVLLPAFKLHNKYAYTEYYEFASGKTDAMVSAIVSERDFIGKKYDWLGLLSFGLRMLIWKLTGKRDFMHPVHSKSRLFCSEYVAQILNKAYSAKVFQKPENVSPADLRNWLAGNRDFRRLGRTPW